MLFFKKKNENQGKSLIKQNTSQGFSEDIEINLDRVKQLFKDDDFLVVRRFTTDGLCPVKCAVLLIQSMTDDYIVSQFLMNGSIGEKITAGDDPIDAIYSQSLFGSNIKIVSDFDEAMDDLLAGSAILLCDGSAKAVSADSKGYESRGITEPENEKLIRGPKECFVEKLVTNVSLIKRRIINTDFKCKMTVLGRKTKTKVAVCYLEGVADKKIVDEVFSRLQKIDIDGIIASNYIEELIRDEKYSPFGTVGSTERPDVTVARILEGRVAIIVNGSPSVLTVPYLFVENFQSADDYYSNFLYSNIGRALRFVSFFLTLTIPALVVSFITFQKQMLPTIFTLSIISDREGVPFPAIVECLGLLLIFEMLRETALRMPSGISQTLSIVGGIVIGESAISAKIISATMVISIGITILTGLMLPRLRGAVIYYRLLFLICSTVIGLYGYLFAFCILIIDLSSLSSFGVKYTSSFFKVRFQQLKDVLIRVPWAEMKERPDELTNNVIRQKSE